MHVEDGDTTLLQGINNTNVCITSCRTGLQFFFSSGSLTPRYLRIGLERHCELDAAQARDGKSADNEHGGETSGIAGVLGTNTATMGILMGSTTVTEQTVGSGTINIEIEMRAAHEHRQSRTKPANWKVMTKTQRTHWYKRKSGEDGWSARET